MTWAYDSYCNDNILEYIEEYFGLEDKFKSLTLEEPFIEVFIKELLCDGGEYNLEFILGLGIYYIRTGFKFSDEILLILLEVCDYLLENGQFKYWKDKEKRKIKITHERRVIDGIFRKKKVTFGKLIQKPKEFENLNDFYNVINLCGI